jgi:hypothetical protein
MNNIETIIDFLRYTMSKDFYETKVMPQLQKSEAEAKFIEFEHKIEDLENKYAETVTELKEIKGLLWKRESKKDESIIEFKEKALNIKEVDSIYCKQNPNGVSFLILINPTDLSKTLRQIVSIQIDMENKYDDVFFEFLVENKYSNKSDPSGWSPLLIRS